MYFNKILFQGCKKRINTLWKDIQQNKNLLVVLAPKNPNDRFYWRIENGVTFEGKNWKIKNGLFYSEIKGSFNTGCKPPISAFEIFNYNNRDIYIELYYISDDDYGTFKSKPFTSTYF